MAKRKKSSFGSGYWFKSAWILSIIISVIPIINWWAGFIHRIVKGNILGAIVFFFLGGILGFVDFITILLSNRIVLLA